RAAPQQGRQQRVIQSSHSLRVARASPEMFVATEKIARITHASNHSRIREELKNPVQEEKMLRCIITETHFPLTLSEQPHESHVEAGIATAESQRSLDEYRPVQQTVHQYVRILDEAAEDSQ